MTALLLILATVGWAVFGVHVWWTASVRAERDAARSESEAARKQLKRIDALHTDEVRRLNAVIGSQRTRAAECLAALDDFEGRTPGARVAAVKRLLSDFHGRLGL